MSDGLAKADRSNLGVTCGQCGSTDVMFVACPDHEWAVAFMCFSCLQAVPVGAGECQECGWKGGDR